MKIVCFAVAALSAGMSFATPLLIYAMDTDTVDITVTGNVFENVVLRGLG